ncbi:uncharacterized protein MYCFIDRAFT_196320 [Pseudocercospora fijiensis CIRAD86]|uniref:Uncharacterized protein n=1 Tax=Pseudocercospora fijiensis (strain CIRAD86) TaxID=383855 RepID=M3AE88_PSEFD|nr:uncharacterized protein MYCFIDRAFT_196320 [Pseudocercospora fijiensis CIRAD86]EME82886.1 hypothetical protein MYCFIDRAFT_196320 [Pseudocercospora fijiensis CIRAD86]
MSTEDILRAATGLDQEGMENTKLYADSLLREFSDDGGNLSLVRLKILLARGVDVIGPQPVIIPGTINANSSAFQDFSHSHTARHTFSMRPVKFCSRDDGFRPVVVHSTADLRSFFRRSGPTQTVLEVEEARAMVAFTFG